MIRARARRLGATVSILSLFAFQAFAGSAGAAVPGANVNSEAIPQFYSAGHDAGFRGSFQLKPEEAGTLSKLYLRIDLVAPTTLTTDYKLVKRGGKDVTSSCEAVAEDWLCTFKTVRNTEKISAVVAYDPDGALSVIAKFTWSGTGVPDNDDQSHGDDWDGVAHEATLSTNGNYAGGFTLDGDNSIANNGVGTGNPQSAKLVNLPLGVAATVLDGSATGAYGPCETKGNVNCTGQFGEWIEVLVGDGLPYDVWQIQVTYLSGTPKAFVHRYGDPLAPSQEFVGPCAKKNPTLPCFIWSASTNTATIFTTFNGSWKGL